ncbi:crossover junction endodeoxyribonuclease RuvC [Bacteroidia bacterium]|nr:crossover junction endodeoxyribonuclease RuvC [Bacteroidia bacterium]
MERIIMGIDPGTTIMGYGIIRITGKKIELVVMGVIELKKYANHYIKLKHIFDRTVQLISEYLPDEIAIEAPFFGKNVQSMLKLGRAQGVAMAAAVSRDIPICEYAPRKIKQMITGMGEASKEQVAAILKNTFNIAQLPDALDATDGLAAALCHYYVTSNAALHQIETQKQAMQPNPTQRAKKKTSWETFVSQHPNKVQA